MAKDLDYYLDTTDVKSAIRLVDPKYFQQSSYGFHLSADSAEVLEYLDTVLNPGQKFPMQVMSGPALTLRYFSALPPKLIQMVKEEKILLCVHLPFVVTIYKPFQQLKYQRDAFMELHNYYQSQSILAKVYFLLHCSHPEFDPMGNPHVQWTYWKDVAVQNLLSIQTSFPNLLVENLPGYFKQPMDVSSPNALWEKLIKGTAAEGKVFLALDTEHLYAGGQTLAELLPETIANVKFIHLNAAPPNALFGKFVDLHSYTSIQSSIERNIGPWVQPGSTFSDYFQLGLSHIPGIFERKYMSIQLKDLQLMQSFEF